MRNLLRDLRCIKLNRTPQLHWMMGLRSAFARLGMYGVTSWAVAQPTREIGIRMVVGADTGRILGMVSLYGARLCVGACDRTHSRLRVSPIPGESDIRRQSCRSFHLRDRCVVDDCRGPVGLLLAGAAGQPSGSNDFAALGVTD
ncbi:MAG: hypothetical protein ABJF23_02265 [Bryobacteraceae bacterium]